MRKPGPSRDIASRHDIESSMWRCIRRMGTALAAAMPALLSALSMAAAPQQALAQDAAQYPDRPIHLVVPYPPGGFTDILARLIAQKLTVELGQSVIVDNRGGGGSTIGSGYVAHAKPDGYTLLEVAVDFAINESLVPKMLSYHNDTDFKPVLQTAWSPMVLVTNAAFPPKNLRELIAYAKANPGAVNFASGGNGTGSHLALEMFKTSAGINVVHVPYRGNGPALVDLLGGQVQGMFLQYAVAKPQIEAGKLRVLGTPSGKRSPVLPNIPTLAESGLPGFAVAPWFGIVAPAGTPDAIVAKLNAAIGKIMMQPDVRKELAVQGADAVASTPAQFGKLIDSETKRWADVVKKSGAHVE